MSARSSSPFSRGGLFALMLVGFGAFLVLLYSLANGDSVLSDGQNGRAHAAANGLNGYSALVQLVKADGFDARVSRKESDLKTPGLLVLTPPFNMDPEDLTSIINKRDYLGPTLVILPKWNTVLSRRLNRLEGEDKFNDGWVVLRTPLAPVWAQQDDGPLALGLGCEAYIPFNQDKLDDCFTRDPLSAPILRQLNPKKSIANTTANPKGFKTRYPLDPVSGSLPTSVGFYAKESLERAPLIVDQDNRTIAYSYEPESYFDDIEDRGSEDVGPTNWVVFVIEPDLMNNWGLADEARAMTALSVVRNMNWGDFDRVVFDVTTNGFSANINLLTLAFQPPFVAATICLMLAMIIVVWRSLLRFGPAAAREPEIAFGKSRLVTNGAELIVRAGRLAILAEPYIALSARRTAHALGLAASDWPTIDRALANKAPNEPSFTQRANDLREARKPIDILRAARALNAQTKRPERGK
jgi:hypothetical protein